MVYVAMHEKTTCKFLWELALQTWFLYKMICSSFRKSITISRLFFINNSFKMKKIFFISIVAVCFLTSCRQWYSLQNFLGIGHYEIVSNAENWLDNNRYDSISQKWIGPDSARINYIDAEANKQKWKKCPSLAVTF